MKLARCLQQLYAVPQMLPDFLRTHLVIRSRNVVQKWLVYVATAYTDFSTNVSPGGQEGRCVLTSIFKSFNGGASSAISPEFSLNAHDYVAPFGSDFTSGSTKRPVGRGFLARLRLPILRLPGLRLRVSRVLLQFRLLDSSGCDL